MKLVDKSTRDRKVLAFLKLRERNCIVHSGKWTVAPGIERSQWQRYIVADRILAYTLHNKTLARSCNHCA